MVRPRHLLGSVLLAGMLLESGMGGEAAAPEDLFAEWIADAVPRHYEKREDWGRTKRIAIGLETTGRGLRTRLQPKKKHVPHGLWKHYEVALQDDVGPVRVEIEDLRLTEAGKIGATIHLAAPLYGWARTRIYQRGLHLGTYTAEGTSTVYLKLECEVGIRLDAAMPLPRVVLEPVFRQAEVKLLDFHLERISSADGPVVRELGRGLKRVMERELEPRKLTRKLNRAVEKKRDRLRLDPQDLLAGGWGEWMSLADLPTSR